MHTEDPDLRFRFLTRIYGPLIRWTAREKVKRTLVQYRTRRPVDVSATAGDS